MPKVRFRFNFLLLAILIFSTSCSFDFGNVPEGAQITCKDTTECPGGWVCNTTIGMCVKEIDPNPPKFASVPEISPLYARDSTLVTLKFESDKELFQTPEVKVKLGGAEWPMAVDSAASGGRKYVFTFTALKESLNAYDGNEGTVLVTMVDKSGNKAEGLQAGSIHLDFTAPSIKKELVAGSPVKKAGEVNVTFTLDRAVSADPVVKLGSGKLFTRKSSSGGLSFEYTYTAAEGDAPAEGAKTESVTVEAVDEAGNGLSQVLKDSVTFDYLTPAVVGDITVEPATGYVREGAEVKVSFTSNKALGLAPEVYFGDIKLALSIQSGNDYVLNHIAHEAADIPGSKDLSIKLVDHAGNQNLLEPGNKMVFDFGKPVIANLHTDRQVYGKTAGFCEIKLIFDCSKNVDGGLTVFIDGVEETWACGLFSETSPNYTCSFDACKASFAEGFKTIQVEARDKAGNMDSGSTKVEFDFSPPDYQTGTSTMQLVSDYPNNPVVGVTSVTNGTTVFVTFSLTEELYTDPVDPAKSSPDPRVVACKADGCDPTNAAQAIILDKDTVSSGGRFYKFTKKIAGLPAGLAFASDVYIVPGPNGPIFDKAGNPQTNTIKVTRFEINTNQPAAPSVANVVYRRVPWGQNDASGKFVDKNFTVVCNACQFSSLVEKILIYDSDTPSPGGLIGEYPNPHIGGAFGFDPIKLNGSDRAHVWLATADSAGNISPATEIKSAEWVATMGGKVPGSTLENPNVFTNIGKFQQKLEQGPYVGEPEIFDGNSIKNVSAYGRGNWGEFSPQDTSKLPPVRTNHAMAYDSIRGSIVLFGGYGESGILGDTWESAELKWIKKVPAASPQGRQGHAIGYDGTRNKTVLFGGWGSAEYLNDTWEWNGVNWEQKITKTAPTGRIGPEIAFDSSRGRLVMFGGGAIPNKLDETWEWDGENWSQKAPTISPSARIGHALAYDSNIGKIVLFGGSADSGFLNDTWEWNGENWARKTSVSSPPARSEHALAYDSGRGKTVLFGGCGSSGCLNDTWEWDGENWLQKLPVDSPPMRLQHTLVYDSTRGKTVLLGGDGGSGSLNDTWEWDGENWFKVSPEISPPARYSYSTAYDSKRKRTVMFGGGGSAGSLGDMWEWNGISWIRMSPSTSPTERSGHASVYDEKRGATVLFGGIDGNLNEFNDTWKWDGITWTQVAPLTSPSKRSRHSMVYDSNRGLTVLFGGSGWLNDTWEWDGENWIQRNLITSPSGRYNHAFSYDKARKKTVLFGGWGLSGYLNDTWEWDGELWIPKTPATIPPARYSHCMIYDSARGKTILFGGVGTYGYQNDIWEWDGSDWTKQLPATNPSPRIDADMGNSVGGMVLLFGGRDSSGSINDTWEWDGQGKGVAGQTAEIAATAMGVLREGASKANLKLITSRFFSGGSGYPWDDGNHQSNLIKGVNLMAWYDNNWWPIASNNSSAAAPGIVEKTITDSLLINKMLLNPKQSFIFAVVPIAPNGFGDPNCVDPATNHCDMGQVSTEYMEVTVKYTLP